MRTSTRVESRPRSRGRTWNGPFATSAIPGARTRKSPVEAGLSRASSSWPRVSARSGIDCESRRLRAAVTVTLAASVPMLSLRSAATDASAPSTAKCLAASEKPAARALTR